MNILFIHANNEDIGGADYCLFKLVYELHKRENKFKPLVILSKNTSVINLYSKYNIPLIILPMVRIQKRGNFSYFFSLFVNFPKTIYNLIKIIKRNKIDLIFSNDLLDIYGPIVGKILKIKSTQYIRMILPNNSLIKKLLVTLTTKLNSKVLVVSKSVQSYMFPNFSKKIEVCNDWIDMRLVGHEIKKKNIKEELNLNGKIIITSISRLEPWKGQEILIRAIPIIIRQFKNVAFLIIGGVVKGRGRENYGLYLKNLAKKLNVDNYIYFLGERKDVKAILINTDIFVHSPIQPDPFPGVILEAMASKTAVVASNDGGIVEQISNGETGLFFDVGKPEDLANKIIFLLKNKEKIKIFGENGYKRVNNLYTKKNILPKLENLLENI